MTSSESPLTDARARQLLARAAEIDAALSPPNQVAELRRAALEAGIHPAAFDRAARELLAEPDGPKPSLWWRVRQNLLGAGVFWITLVAIVQPLIWLDVAEPGRTLGMLIAGFGGIQIADRLRARLVRTALIAVNAGQAVLFGFSVAGITGAGPNVLTWAVLLTGILATGAAALYGEKDRHLSPASPLPLTDTQESPPGNAGDSSLLMATPDPE